MTSEAQSTPVSTPSGLSAGLEGQGATQETQDATEAAQRRSEGAAARDLSNALRRAAIAEARVAELEATVAKAWDEGFATGKSRAMRHMSDEPSLSLYAPNPYRAALDAPKDTAAP